MTKPATDDGSLVSISGHLVYRERGGALVRTRFELDVSIGRVRLCYDDGVDHVSEHPAVVAYFATGLVPSLQEIAR